MADNITKKDYITITDTKVMVGGKETTKYRGHDIWRVEALPSLFKDIQTNNITKKDYITITDKKVMVGGKETTKYRGCDIWHVEALPSLFKDIQTKVKQEYGSAPIEMRVLSSKTSGQYAKPGTPSPKHGKNAWVQFVFANGTKTPWVFRCSHPSAFDCADFCAGDCGLHVQRYSDFRSGVFGSVADAIKPVVQVNPKVVNRSGDVTTMKIDFGKQKLQFQINASLILKQLGK